MDIVDEALLGRERVDFATPGSAMAEQLTALPAAAEAGWYRDPLGNSKVARMYNGEAWTGLTRVILDQPKRAVTPVARSPWPAERVPEPIVVEHRHRTWTFRQDRWHIEGSGTAEPTEMAVDPAVLPFTDKKELTSYPAQFMSIRPDIIQWLRASAAAGRLGEFELAFRCTDGAAQIVNAQGGWFKRMPLVQWFNRTFDLLVNSGAIFGATEVYGSIPTIAKVLTTNGRAGKWRRYDSGPALVVLEPCVVYDGRQFDYDPYVAVSLTLDGDLITSHRPTLTRMAAFSVLPGTALIPGLALPKEQRTDERVAILAITHPDWQLAVQVDVDDLPRIRPVVQRLEVRLAQLARNADDTPATTPEPTSAVAELAQIAAMVQSGFLSTDEGAALKAEIIAKTASASEGGTR